MSSLNVVNPPTFGFSRASGGQRAVPGTPTTRSPAPTRYAISTVSAVRQTTRLGNSVEPVPYIRPRFYARGGSAGGGKWRERFSPRTSTALQNEPSEFGVTCRTSGGI